MAFTQKLLSFQITLASGVFDGGGNSTTLSGLRASANIANAGGPDMGILSADIYGLSLSKMNQLTTFGTEQGRISQNSIVVMAGDGDAYGNPTGPLATIFHGTITTAFTNAQAQPQVSFHIDAVAGALQAVQPMDPTSMQGGADVVDIFSKLAQGMGLTFSNNGVTGQIANPYLWGSGRNQVMSLAKAIGCQWDLDNTSLAIWPTNGSRDNNMITISPQTGMVGYPAFNSAGIVVKALFDPNGPVLRGKNINVQSDLTPACGTWNVAALELSLQSQIPRGDWYVIASANRGSVGG